MSDAPAPAPAKRSKRLAAGGAGAVLLAAVVGGGAYAYNQLSGGGPQPADVLPADTEMYVRLDLDPGAGQKIQLFQLLNKVPEVGEALGIEDPDQSDVRKLVFDALSDSACPDIDYADDVEPWLGDRVGAGVNIAEERFVLAIQVKDEQKAETGIDQLFECAGEDHGIAFYEGYALVAPSQDMVDAALDDAREEPLSGTEAFSASMDRLGEQGVASAWIDSGALAESLPEMLSIPGFELSEEELDQAQAAGPVALALRVDGDAIELAGVGDEVEDLASEGTPIGNLPTDTVVGLSIAGFGDAIGEQWDLLIEQFDSFGAATGFAGGQPQLDQEFLDGLDPETRDIYENLLEDDSAGGLPDPDDIIADIEDETGLTLPDDLETLLGTSITLAVGGDNLELIPTLSGPADVAQLNVALHAGGDPGEVAEVFGSLADYLERQSGIALITEETDDGAVLATSSSAATTLADGGDLGGQDSFEAVMPFGDDTGQSLFVDVGAIIEKILDADPPEDIRADIEEWNVFDAVGLSAGNVDGASKFSLRVNFAD